MNLEALTQAIVLGMVAGATSVTITKAKVFASLRTVIKARSEWAGTLVSCHYCTSHWVSFALVAIYRPVVVTSGVLVVDLAVGAMFITCVSALTAASICTLIPFAAGKGAA